MENLTAYLPLLLQGLRMTLILAVSTLVVGLALGMLLALAKLSRHAWLSRPVHAVTNFLRGVALIGLYLAGANLIAILILNIFVSIESSDRTLVPVAPTHGATPLQAFLEVTLPLSMPGVATGALLAFVLAAGSYVTPLILGGPDDFLFGNLIYGTVMTELNWPLGSVLAIALTLILGALIMIYNRFFGLERLTRGLA